MKDRAPVQGTRRLNKPPGTISWEEHVKAWEAYNAKYGNHQDAERIAQRGGFDYAELLEFLGEEPKTWRSRRACSTCGKEGRPIDHAGWHPDDEKRG
jgi:hypothetical protein